MSARRVLGLTHKTCGFTTYNETPPPNLKSMSNSERGKYYRRRRKRYNAHLSKRVAELRDEIAALTISRQVQDELALSLRSTPLGAAARIVNEYWSLFQRGTPVRLIVDEQSASAALVAQATNAQRGFLTAVTTEDVRFGEFWGTELLLTQWERYSLFHAAIEWTIKSFHIAQVTEPHVVTGNDWDDDEALDVVITAELRVRISRRTVEEVFPHLVGDEALMQALIGLELAYPCVNRFHFNSGGKIKWYAPEVDFVGAMMAALRAPEVVVRVLSLALIAKDHMIGDESDGRELAAVKFLEKEELPRMPDYSSTDSYRPREIKRSWKDEMVAVVSDDEVSCEPASKRRLDRFDLAYILCE